ncbi:MAG: NPCBM/NEW2 domain-containing protein [Planctomycetales bacterium]
MPPMRHIHCRFLRATLGWFGHRAGLVWLALCVFSATPGVAQENPNRSVRITTRDGRTVSGSLSEWTADEFALGANPSQRWGIGHIVSIRFQDRRQGAHPADPLVLLANGDQFAARVVSSDEDALTVRWARFPHWSGFKIPLEGARGVILQRPANPQADARLWTRIAEHRERHDLVVLGNGDTLIGHLSGLDERSLTLETTNGKSVIDRGSIQAVAFNAALVNLPQSPEEVGLVSLIDGSHFRLEGLHKGALERIEGRSACGATIDLPLLAVESVRYLGGCATYLSDLEPLHVRSEPFFELDWPLRRDRNVLGGPLRLRGVDTPKGLGMHSAGEVAYRLEGKYKWFLASLGIDDQTQGQGNATFEILVDGKSHFQSEALTGTSPVAVIPPIDLSGAKTLTLKVDFGALGNIQDHADWCEAVLVR